MKDLYSCRDPSAQTSTPMSTCIRVPILLKSAFLSFLAAATMRGAAARDELTHLLVASTLHEKQLHKGQQRRATRSRAARSAWRCIISHLAVGSFIYFFILFCSCRFLLFIASTITRRPSSTDLFYREGESLERLHV